MLHYDHNDCDDDAEDDKDKTLKTFIFLSYLLCTIKYADEVCWWWQKESGFYDYQWQERKMPF